MKKGKPGVIVSCLLREPNLAPVIEVVFRCLPTLGVRYQVLRRSVLSREHSTVDTEFGPIRVKLGKWGERVFVATPEFEDCRTAAAAAGVPVRRAILAATRAAGIEPPSSDLS